MAQLEKHPSRRMIEVDRSGSTTVVRVYGGLDQTTAGALNVCLSGLADGGVDDVVLELAGVPYCDAEGLGALLGAHRRLHGHLEVRSAPPEVRHSIAERGLDCVLRVV